MSSHGKAYDRTFGRTNIDTYVRAIVWADGTDPGPDARTNVNAHFVAIRWTNLNAHVVAISRTNESYLAPDVGTDDTHDHITADTNAISGANQEPHGWAHVFADAEAINRANVWANANAHMAAHFKSCNSADSTTDVFSITGTYGGAYHGTDRPSNDAANRTTYDAANFNTFFAAISCSDTRSDAPPNRSTDTTTNLRADTGSDATTNSNTTDATPDAQPKWGSDGLSNVGANTPTDAWTDELANA
jgi:hypothetical protein